MKISLEAWGLEKPLKLDKKKFNLYSEQEVYRDITTMTIISTQKKKMK